MCNQPSTRRLITTLAMAIVALAGVSTVSAQDLPDPEVVAGGTGVLVGTAVSWVFTLANLNNSPEGDVVAGGLGSAVGAATVIGGAWWMTKAETTTGDVTGGVIIASGFVAVVTGVRSMRQASARGTSEPAEPVTLAPVFMRDASGGTDTGMAVVVRF